MCQLLAINISQTAREKKYTHTLASLGGHKFYALVFVFIRRQNGANRNVPRPPLSPRECRSCACSWPPRTYCARLGVNCRVYVYMYTTVARRPSEGIHTHTHVLGNFSRVSFNSSRDEYTHTLWGGLWFVRERRKKKQRQLDKATIVVWITDFIRV